PDASPPSGTRPSPARCCWWPSPSTAGCRYASPGNCSRPRGRTVSSDVILRKAGPPAAAEPPAESPRARWRSAARWETGLVVVLVGGALNGVLVARVGLPSIAVTIGTLTLFRGLAEVLLGSDTIPTIGDREFPGWLTDIGANSIPGTQFSWSMLIFIVLAVVF